ncbi:MAG: MtrB/PioB family outer membrane beta-barrel protein [Oligoflexia bacterium]|nr:MtrB/PioB family outer membrane beta-barrel protein [Oligoflexia bacterium]
MRNLKYLTGIALLASTGAWAETEYSANAGVGLRLSKGDEVSARFTEYQDLSSGVVSNLEAAYFDGAYHMQLFAQNIGRNDQGYSLSGGRYHQFTYKAWFDELPHNLSFNSLQFYTSGLGTNTLTYTAAGAGGATSTTFLDTNVSDMSKWLPHDYKLERKDLGASVLISMDTPFFGDLSVSRVSMTGTRPIATASGVYPTGGGTSGFAPFEFPEPVDQNTTTTNLEAGYKTDMVYLSATGTLSKFNSEWDYLTFRNPMVGTTELNEKLSLSPDSDSKKLAVQATVYKLPFDSTFQARGSTEEITNTIPLETSLAPGGTGTYTPVTLGVNEPDFKGDISYKNASAVWSARPFEHLDADVFYRFLDKKNHSTKVIYSDSPTAPTATQANEHFGYRKNNIGGELGYLFPARTKVRGGYEYEARVREERTDANASFEKSLFAEVKNSFFDFATAKVKYGYLRRTSEWGKAETAGTTKTATSYVLNFVRRFDVNEKRQNSILAAVTLTPMDDVDLGVGYRWKKSVYDQTQIGLQDDFGREWNFDASFRLPEVFKITAFADIEKVNRHAFHRQFTNAPDPFGATQNTTNFNFDETWTDNNYRYGLILQVPVIEDLLDFETSYAQEVANAFADLEAQTGGPTLVDIQNFGNYRKNSLSAKFSYKVNESLSAALAGFWERLRSDDVQFNQYVYNGVAGSNGAQRFLFTGAYKDNEYSATTGVVTVSYKF